MSRRFEVGAKVYNSQLGAGEVLSVDGYGEKEKLTIHFESSGVRQILSKFFVLEPYDNELHAEPAAPPGAPPDAASAVSPDVSHGASAPPESMSPRDPPPSLARVEPRPSMAPPALSSLREERPRSEPRPDAVGRAIPSAASTGSIKEALREVLREELGASLIKMTDRYRGGSIVIKAGRAGLADKVVPIDAFFHKIVMVRDRLRVLEQKINAHSSLSDADRVDMQQYVTRIYGSLTTFNVLFAERDDWFVGQKGEEE